MIEKKVTRASSGSERLLALDVERLGVVYRLLLARYGPQHWWPGDSPFEVMVGAILTQNTAWTNVERGLGRLREHIPLQAQAILSLPRDELAEYLRPVGYFNVKSKRLRDFCRAYLEAGSYVQEKDGSSSADFMESCLSPLIRPSITYVLGKSPVAAGRTRRRGGLPCNRCGD